MVIYFFTKNMKYNIYLRSILVLTQYRLKAYPVGSIYFFNQNMKYNIYLILSN